MPKPAQRPPEPTGYEFWDFALERDNSEESKAKAAKLGGIDMIKGTGMNLRRMTANGGIYRERAFRAILSDLRQMIEEGKIVGLYGHPMPAHMGASAAPRDEAILWLGIRIDKDYNVLVEGVIGNSAAGQDMVAMMDIGRRYGLSSRFRVVWEWIEEMGEKDPDWRFNKEFKGQGFYASKEIKLPGGWDAVYAPSNKDAWTEDEMTETMRRRHEMPDAEPNNDDPEEDVMPWDKIKKMEDFENTAPASVRDMVVAAVTAQIRPDIEAEITESMTAKAQADLEEAFKDKPKVCEALEVTEEQLAFAKKNAEHLPALEKLIEAGLDVSKLIAAAPPATPDAKDEAIEALTTKVTSMESKMTTLETEATEAKAMLAARDADTALDALIEKHTKGEPGEEIIAKVARKDLKAGATEDAVKTAVEEAKSILKQAGIEFKPSNGKGHTGADAKGGSEQGVENIVQRRKAFVEQHKLLAGPGTPEIVQSAMERADLDASVFGEWAALYSAEAIAKYPLS